MTRWNPEVIAYHAQRAGFRGDDLPVAVAVALAASQGYDDAEVATPTPPQRLWRGLWLVPVDLADPLGILNLFDPTSNANAAFLLWEAHGNSWDWSPTFGAGRWQRYLGDAQDAAARPSPTQAAATAPLLHRVLALSAALRNTTNSLTGR